jgi:mRNA interferase MazF
LKRGEVWWATLPDPVGSGPGYRRPVVIVQADPFNASRVKTVIVAAISSSSRVKAAPGNVHLPVQTSGLSRESVVNVTQLLAVDKNLLLLRVGHLPPYELHELNDGLRLVLAL